MSTSYKPHPALIAIGDLTVDNYTRWMTAFRRAVDGATKGLGLMVLDGQFPKPISPSSQLAQKDPTAFKSTLELAAKYAESVSILQTFLDLHLGAQGKSIIMGISDPQKQMEALAKRMGTAASGQARVRGLRKLVTTEQGPEEDAILFITKFLERLDALSQMYKDAKLADPFADDGFRRDLYLVVINKTWDDYLSPLITDATTMNDVMDKARVRQENLKLREEDPRSTSVAALAASNSPSYLASRASTPPSRHSHSSSRTPHRQGPSSSSSPSTHRAQRGADEYVNYQNWPHGTHKSRKPPYLLQFALGKTQCWKCFGLGHFGMECPLSDSFAQAEIARSQELAKYGISVSPSSTKALTASMQEVYQVEEEDRAAAAHYASMSEQERDEEEANWLAVGGGLADDEAYVAHASAHVARHYDTPPHGRVADLNLSAADRPHFDHSYGVRRPTPPHLENPARLAAASRNSNQTGFVQEMARSFFGDNFVSALFCTIAEAFSSNPSSKTTRTILDSGASRHMWTRKDDLFNYRPFSAAERIPIGGVFGVKGWAEGEGDLRYEFTVPGGDKRRVIVRKVLLVPSLGINLLSSTALMAEGYKFTNTRLVQSLSNERGILLAEFAIAGNKIFVEASPIRPQPRLPIPVSSSLLASPVTDHALTVSARAAGLNLWHCRFGHPSGVRLTMAERGAVDGMVVGDRDMGECIACAKGKMTRITRPISTKPYENLDVVAADLHGPTRVQGRRGERLILGIVDAGSRYFWAEYLRTKDEVVDIIPRFVAAREREMGRPLKVFRSDRGGEFVNSRLSTYFLDNGIQHQRSIAYEHEQNGLIEAQWRSLNATARAALWDSGFPPSFFFDAFRWTVYTRNLTPSTSSKIRGRTPHEAYFGTIPNVAHLRRFGCDVEYIDNAPGRSKQAPITRSGSMIGYVLNSNGYYILDTVSGRVVEAIQVRFFEESFRRKRTVEEEREMKDWMAAEEEGDTMDRGDIGGTSREEDGLEDNGRGGVANVVPAQQGTEPTDQEEPAPAPQQQDAPPRAATPAPPAREPTPAPTPPPAAEQQVPTRLSRELRGLQFDAAGPSNSSLPAPATEGRRSTRSSTVNAAFAASASTSGLQLGGDVSPSGTPPPTVRPPPCTSRAKRSDPPRLLPVFAAMSEDYASLLTHAVNDLDQWDQAGDPTVEVYAVSRVTNNPDQPTFSQAISGADAAMWDPAFAAELGSLRAMGAFGDEELLELPTGANAVGCQWVCLIKRDVNGNVIKFKARLVARGDQQIDGVDFTHTFSNTVRLSSVRLALAIAAREGWEVRQFDVSSAYLHAPLEEEVYIRCGVAG